MKSPLLIPLAGVCMLATAWAEPPNAQETPLAPLVRHVISNPDGNAPWSVDMRALDGDRSALPVGVFDSGIGGLTVMEAILSLDAFNNQTLQPGADGVPDFAGERFVYFGDQANMPYGNYPQKGRELFLRELIVKDAVFLLGRRYHGGGAVKSDKPPVKAIVIACNTATAYGIEDIRASLRAWNLDVPVIGVVEAGARAVNETLPANGRSGTIAVLATVGTCRSDAYPRAIGRAGGLAGKMIPSIVQHGSVGLAGALEGDPTFVSSALKGSQWNNSYLGPAVDNEAALIDPALLPVYGFDQNGLLGDATQPAIRQLNSAENYARYDVVTLVEKYRRTGGGAPITTLVLGCTHYPIAQREISAAFDHLRNFKSADGGQPYRALIAEKIEFVNPAEFTAKELFRELARGRLRAARDSTAPPVLDRIFVSVPNGKWIGARLTNGGPFDPGYKYGRKAGTPAVEDTLCVPLKEAGEVLDSLSGLAPALPRVWSNLNRE
jgi:glutamate racemase